MSIEDKLSQLPPRSKRSKVPLWKGPTEDGVTFSLLSRFLVCRERFRITVIDGLKPAKTFNHRVEYGNMWHCMEEAFASEIPSREGGAIDCALGELRHYCSKLCQAHVHQSAEIEHWYNVAKVQFPLYERHWANHKDTEERTPLLQEQVFDVPYTLPSGRVVRLRGKFDAVDLIGKGKNAGIYLFETKTKGDVREEQIRRQLRADLQTMLYMIVLTQDTGIQALEEVKETLHKGVRGVRYNVVRRPLSGGKGNIVRHKPTKSNPQGETKEHFYGRVASYIEEDPGSYFMRWTVGVTPQDVDKFRRTCLDPILEQLCDWHEWVSAPGDCFGHKSMRIQGVNHKVDMPNAVHYITPYGVHNSLLDGGSTDLDSYLETGSTVGLERVDDLFPELGG